jgi:tetratricopeptide (TPR) repeat protein
VPRDLETIALKCLRKEPGERYGTAEALAQDLRRFVRGDPIEARPQPFLEKMGRRLCRNRLRVAAAGLLGLLLLTSGLLLLRYRRDLEAENLAEYREKIFSAIGKMELGRWSRRAERRSFPGTRSARAVVARSAPPGSEGESAALLSTAFAAEAEYGDTVRDPVEEAAEDLRRAAALLPGKPEAHFYFARSQRLLGRDEAAKERLDRALGCDPGFFPALIERESASGRADEEVVARLEHALAAAGQAGIAKDSILAYRAKAKREWQEAEKALGRLLASFSAGAEPSEPYIGFRLQALLERGRARIETGDLDGAVEDFVTARALWPELSEPVLLLGKTYHLQGDTARAEAGFEEFHGKTQRKDEFALEVAWLCIKSLREYERGLAWAEKASESAHREALRAQFMSLYLGRAEEGLVAATRAVELDPNLSRAHSALAIALQATDKLDEAIAEHRKAIELDPGQSMPHNNLASILREQGKLEEAVAECRIAIELNPNDSVHRMSLGSAFHDLGKLEEAIAEYRKAIELDPKDALAHNNLGQAFCRQGKLEEAIAEHRKAIELDPKDARHHNSLGVALGFQGKREESIDEYRKAIELDPKFILARRNLGTALRRQGKLLEAIAEFRKAIEIDPDAPESHNDLGSAFRDQGNLEEAIAEYQKVTELNPKSARVRCSLGLVFMNQGRLDEAGAMFRKAIELDPSYAVARNCLGNALLKQSKPGEAEVALRKATELDPKIADFHTNLGIALRDQGKLDESEAAYRKAIEIDPRSHHGYCNYANLLGGQGRLREALAVSAGAVATNAFCQATLVQLPDLFGRLGDMDGGTDIESIAGALKKGLFGSSYLELPASGAPEMERRLKALALALVCNSPARDPDGAVEVARRLAERSDPVGPDGLSFVAEIQFRGGKLPAAIETLERLVSLPGSSQEHGVLLEQCRQAALPDLPTFGSIDAALERPQAAALIPERPERGSSRGVTEASEGREDGSVEGEAERREILEFDPERFEAFRTRVQERGTVGAGLLAYLEARLLQRRGAHREAVAKLEEAIAASPAKAEPYLRLVESLRALSESARAEPRLREALHGGAVDSSGVWDAWWAAAAEAKVSPEEILKLVSQAASATPQSYAADLLWALQRLSEDGAIRINCGGEENRGADGKLWGKDRFALGGRVREARADRSVEGTEDDEIYRTARWFPRGDAAHTAYRIPVPAGRYRLTLGFAEVTSSEAEKRRFDVLLEGRTILDDYEPKVDTAENFTFEQTVEDGHLDIEFVHKVDDPEISAIAIERLP